MDDRRLVHAVEFLAMDLIGVEHRRVRERQLFAAAEHRCFLRTADAGEHVEDLAAPRRQAAGYPDGQCIGDEGLGRGRAASGTPCSATLSTCATILSTTGSCNAALTRLAALGTLSRVRERG